MDWGLCPPICLMTQNSVSLHAYKEQLLDTKNKASNKFVEREEEKAAVPGSCGRGKRLR